LQHAESFGSQQLFQDDEPQVLVVELRQVSDALQHVDPHRVSLAWQGVGAQLLLLFGSHPLAQQLEPQQYSLVPQHLPAPWQ
jgi:hypothetical protein